MCIIPQVQIEWKQNEKGKTSKLEIHSSFLSHDIFFLLPKPELDLCVTRDRLAPRTFTPIFLLSFRIGFVSGTGGRI